MTVGATPSEGAIVTKFSPRSVPETVARLIEMVAAREMRLFAVIDQSVEAQQVGLQLRETTLVVFGNARAGTPIMNASPLAALDLPLKVLIWADEGRTQVSYYSPSWLGVQHRLAHDLVASLAGIDALTDALVAP